MKTFYRIVEVSKKEQLKTLFHGVKGSRVLPVNKWLKAEKKFVQDGSGPHYLSGFHVLPTCQDAYEYMEAFDTTRRELAVIAVYAKGLRRKKHSRSPVFLANQMFIPFSKL